MIEYNNTTQLILTAIFFPFLCKMFSRCGTFDNSKRGSISLSYLLPDLTPSGIKFRKTQEHSLVVPHAIPENQFQWRFEQWQISWTRCVTLEWSILTETINNSNKSEIILRSRLISRSFAYAVLLIKGSPVRIVCFRTILLEVWGKSLIKCPKLISILILAFLDRCTVHFDICTVHSPTNALFN